MEATAGSAEPLNKEGLTRLMERAGDGPVVMLNLLAFKPDGGAERYLEYAAAVAPLLEQVGGRIIWAGQPATPVIGERGWDMVALAEYPTRQAFLEMTSSPEYEAIGHLRSESVARSELHPMDPAELTGL